MQGEEEEEANCGKEDNFSFLEFSNTTTGPGDHLNMMNLHFDVFEAALKSFQTNSITPIVKEELKLKIQTSRLAAGKEELPTPEFKEPQKYQLTAEEEEKRRIKRERNRIAAEKCRKKKKMMGDNNSQELHALQQQNDQLKEQVTSLEKEIGKIRASLLSVGIVYTRVQQETTGLAVPSTSATSVEYQTQFFPELSPCSTQSEFSFQSPSPSFPQVASPAFTQATSPVSTQATTPVSTQGNFSFDSLDHMVQVSNTFQSDPYMTPQWPPQLCAEEQQHLPETVTFGDCFLENEPEDIPNFDEINNFVSDEAEAQVPVPQLDFTTEMPSFY